MLLRLPSMSWKRQGGKKCRPLKNQLFLILDHDIINIGSFFTIIAQIIKIGFWFEHFPINFIWEMKALRKVL